MTTKTIGLLMENEDIFPIILENIPQHVFWKDTNGKFMGCNRNFAKALGFSNPQEIIGKTDFDVTDQEKAERFLRIDKKVIEENHPIYHMKECYKDASGKKLWLNVNKVPLHDEHGNVIGVLGTLEDVTEQVELENKLRHNTEKYVELIESTNAAYVILSDSMNILDANSIFLKLIGCSSLNECLNKNPRTWIAAEHVKKFDNAFNQILNGHPMLDLEVCFININGTPINVAINANIIENGGKKIVCLARNISNKKKKEAEKFIMQEKRKDRIKQNISAIRSQIKKRLGE